MIYILPKFGKSPYKGVEIDTTSNVGDFRELSPFILGPCATYDADRLSMNFENLWQYSKVYHDFLDTLNNPSVEYFIWRNLGWGSKRANRYPMGKGRTPAYAWWNGEKLGYIAARKAIYARFYAENVVGTRSYLCLKEIYDSGQNIILRDYDGYDHRLLGMSLKDVINEPNKKMGHAFVLAMILLTQLEVCLGTNQQEGESEEQLV